MKANLNLDYLITDLDESEMESVAGGTNAAFFDRWAGKINAGNLNMQKITQRFLSDFNKGVSYSAARDNYNGWKAGTTVQSRNAWRNAGGVLQYYLGQASLPGATANIRQSFNDFFNYTSF